MRQDSASKVLCFNRQDETHYNRTSYVTILLAACSIHKLSASYEERAVIGFPFARLMQCFFEICYTAILTMHSCLRENNIVHSPNDHLNTTLHQNLLSPKNLNMNINYHKKGYDRLKEEDGKKGRLSIRKLLQVTTRSTSNHSKCSVSSNT